jgi:hypothetical protein
MMRSRALPVILHVGARVTRLEGNHVDQRARTRPSLAAPLVPALLSALLLVLTSGALRTAATVEPAFLVDVSWQRPGSDFVHRPPAELRTGDTVRIGWTSPGTSHWSVRRCAVGIQDQGAGRRTMTAHAKGICDAGSWTFVLPPSPPGPYEITRELYGYDGAPSQETLRVLRPGPIALTVEDGGAHRPFSTDFPVASWAPIDTFGDEAPRVGEPLRITPAAGDHCSADLRSDRRQLSLFPRPCGPFTLTLPRETGEWVTSQPWSGLATFGASVGPWGYMDDEPARYGYTYTGDLRMERAPAGVEPVFASSAPAVMLDPARNPQFVYEGEPMALDATVRNITTGTCEFQLLDADLRTISVYVPISDGRCVTSEHVAPARDTTQVTVLVTGTTDADRTTELHARVAWWVTVVDRLPAPDLAPPLQVEAGTDVRLSTRVGTGAPTAFSVTAATTGSTQPVTIAGGGLDPSRRSGTGQGTWRTGRAGDYVLSSTFRDVRANRRTTTRRVKVVDTQPPVVAIPAARPAVGMRIEGASTPTRVTWSATDAGSGIARTELQERIDGGVWVTVKLASPTATSVVRWLAAGRKYEYRARAVDGLGQVSAWRSGGLITPVVWQDTSSLVTYTGPWSTRWTAGASGGTVHAASSTSARASITFTGRRVAVVAPMGPGYKKSQIYLDGRLAGTIDPNRPTTSARVVVFEAGLTGTGTHRLELRVLPGVDGRTFALDAIVAHR